MVRQPDAMLVQAALGGNVDGFASLCERYYPAMVAIAHAILADRHLAEDAAQETFAKALLNLKSLKKPDRFAPWVASICRNQARDMTRATRKEQSLEDWDMPPDSYQQEPEFDAVREAIESLPANAKEVIYLKYYNELSYRQMSAVLEISEQAIGGRVRRARNAIAAYLKRQADIEGRQ